MRTCNTSFNLDLLRLKSRRVNWGEAHSTFSFVLMQSFRSIQDVFHLSTLQSFIAARQLAYGIGTKSSGPKQLNADPDLASVSTFSLPWMPVWPGVHATMT